MKQKFRFQIHRQALDEGERSSQTQERTDGDLSRLAPTKRTALAAVALPLAILVLFGFLHALTGLATGWFIGRTEHDPLEGHRIDRDAGFCGSMSSDAEDRVAETYIEAEQRATIMVSRTCCPACGEAIELFRTPRGLRCFRCLKKMDSSGLGFSWTL